MRRHIKRGGGKIQHAGRSQELDATRAIALRAASTLMEEAVGVRGAHPDELAGQAAVLRDPALDFPVISAPQGRGGFGVLRQMKSERCRGRHANAAPRNVTEQYRAGRLAWPDNADIDALRGKPGPAGV